jgi:isocitrate dehydrogenase (NAD+)
MIPGARYEDIDIVLIRENIEGLYVAFEHLMRLATIRVPAICGRVTRAECMRITRYALNMRSSMGESGHHYP